MNCNGTGVEAGKNSGFNENDDSDRLSVSGPM